MVTQIPKRHQTGGGSLKVCEKSRGVHWKSKMQNKGICSYTWSRRLFGMDLARRVVGSISIGSATCFQTSDFTLDFRFQIPDFGVLE